MIHGIKEIIRNFCDGIYIVLFIFGATVVSGQNNDIHLDTAGVLYSKINSLKVSSITRLRLTGRVDARDFRFIRDSLPNLQELDMDSVTIVPYSGTEGTLKGNQHYFAFEIPASSFEKKETLHVVNLPGNMVHIGAYAFADCIELRELLIPFSVKTIDSYAFKNVCQITELVLPEQLSEIKEGSFMGCTSLTMIEIPQRVHHIGEGSFFNCISLNQINLPTSLSSIGEKAFMRCTQLSFIYLPSGLKEVGDSAFAYCSRLRSIENGSATPQPISASVFWGVNRHSCKVMVSKASFEVYQKDEVWKGFNLTSSTGFLVSVRSVEPQYGTVSEQNELFYPIYKPLCFVAIPDKACRFLYWTNPDNKIVSKEDTLRLILSQDVFLKAHFSPESFEYKVRPGKLHEVLSGVKENIRELVLQGRMDARDIQFIRDSLHELVSLDIRNVKIVTYKGEEGTCLGENRLYKGNQIPDYAFQKKDRNLCGLQTIQFPSEVTKIGDFALEGSLLLYRVGLPSGLTHIGKWAFSGCVSLETIALSEPLEQIGDFAFNGCIQLKSIVFPISLIQIGDGAFKKCRSMEQVQLPSKLNRINESAFQECSSLKQVIFPKKLNVIEKQAFAFCEELDDLIFPPKVKKIGQGAFRYCKKMSKVKIPSGVMYIESNTFEQCTSLQEVVFPLSLKSIEEKAFSGCIHLNQLHIPENVSSIKAYAFENCHLRAHIVFPVQLYLIGDGAFENCEFITGFTFPSKLSVIGRSAFQNCRRLQQLVLPESLLTIEPETFKGCISLKDIHFPMHLLVIKEYAFASCKGLEKVIFPPFFHSLGEGAFVSCENLNEVHLPVSLLNIADSTFAGCEKIAVIQNVRTEPVFINSSVFQGVDMNRCKLIVPFEAAREYEQAYLWKSFKIIEEGGFSVEARLNNSLYGRVEGLQTRFYAKGDLLYLKARSKKGYQFSNWASPDWEILSMVDTLPVQVSGNEMIRVYYKERVQSVSVAYTVNPGSLERHVGHKASVITSLLLTGEIDARDICFIRDSMPLLESLDLSRVNIASYQGSKGTVMGEEIRYPAHKLPYCSFCDEYASEQKLQSIRLPLQLKGIGDFAFSGCDELTELDLPDPIVYIGEGAFRNCSRLYTLHFPEKLQSIHPEAFEGCGSLVELYFPPQLRYVGNRAFEGCIRLKKLVFISGGIEIGQEAFASSSDLSLIHIQSYIPLIVDESAFRKVNVHHCKIVVPPLSLMHFQEEKRNGFNRFEASIKEAVKVEVFPSEYGFVKMTEKKEYKKGDRITLTAIAKAGCRFMGWRDQENRLISNEESMKLIWENDTALIAQFTIDTLVYKVKPGELKKRLENNREHIRALVLKGKIDVRDMRYMSDELDLLLFLDLHEVGIVSYQGKEGLQSGHNLHYPAKEIPAYAFMEKPLIESIRLPESCISIGKYAFFNGTHLHQLTLPKSLKKIERYAFYRCFELIQIQNPSSHPALIDDSVFDELDMGNCKLLVPEISVDTYRADEQWGGFQVQENK